MNLINLSHYLVVNDNIAAVGYLRRDDLVAESEADAEKNLKLGSLLAND